ncbi:hypothetical protein SOCE26_046760 [Sorangium cellulosum]|uniref:MxcI protein n=1 Tax=Sorangium cellulosum TaxID=56 RepID=A0A2L0EVC7_SORCE|nr:hypothetical protein [Sorangium cellulosum]AUX43232.1 hypothetical protein SOCE26_046760 [Sorangium cellulosum]
MSRSLRHIKAFLFTLVVPCLVACGDSASDGPGGKEGEGGAGGEGNASGDLFALTTQVFGVDAADTLSYILLTDSLDRDEPLSLDSGIEILGRGIGAGPDGGRALFVASDAAPTVTRYDLGADGSLKEGATVSFQGQGLAKLDEYGGQFQFVSETKAYFFDGATAQVVIWNPKDMTVSGAIPLAELVLPEATLTFSAAPLRVGDAVISFAGWRNGPAVPSQAGIVVVDSATDEATVVTDARCGYVRDGVEAEDGMIYMATEAYGAAVHRLNPDNAAAPCLLRFDLETRKFDPDYHVELGSLFDGAAAGSLIVGSGGEAYLRVLDENAFEIKDDTHPRVLASAAAWRWASVTLGDTPTATVLDAEPTSGSVVNVPLGGKSFVLQFQGQDTTTFRELGESGPGEVSLTAPGVVFSAAKLR